MKYREYLPHSSLQDYVQCFWVLEREYTPEDPYENVTPDACIELIFNFGAPYILHEPAKADRVMPMTFMVGLQKKPLLFGARGTVNLLATRFNAWGLAPFFAPHIKTAAVPTIEVGTEWQELALKVGPHMQVASCEKAVSVVEDFLINKLLAASCDQRTIQVAAQMLLRRQGQFKVSELAEYCNLSSRQLQRHFQNDVGVSPKAFARVIRFQEIRKRLMFEPDISLTDLAYEFGYTDQAHFIHDFREFAEKTPGEFAAEMRTLVAVFRDHDNVVFLQSPSTGSD